MKNNLRFISTSAGVKIYENGKHVKTIASKYKDVIHDYLPFMDRTIIRISSKSLTFFYLKKNIFYFYKTLSIRISIYSN